MGAGREHKLEILSKVVSDMKPGKLVRTSRSDFSMICIAMSSKTRSGSKRGLLPRFYSRNLSCSSHSCFQRGMLSPKSSSGCTADCVFVEEVVVFGKPLNMQEILLLL